MKVIIFLLGCLAGILILWQAGNLSEKFETRKIQRVEQAEIGGCGDEGFRQVLEGK